MQHRFVSEIERARCQLLDAERRLAQQRALAAEMEAYGDHHSASIARRFLANLRQTAAMARARLRLLKPAG